MTIFYGRGASIIKIDEDYQGDYYKFRPHRDFMLNSDYVFTYDEKSRTWKFLKYRFTTEGFNSEFFNVEQLLDYVYKDICLWHRFHPAKDTFGIITVIRNEKDALKIMKMWRNYNA